MTAKDEILEAAKANGWTVRSDKGWTVELYQPLPWNETDKVHNFIKLSNKQYNLHMEPGKLITVYFAEFNHAATGGKLEDHRSFIVATGKYGAIADSVQGKNKKEQILEWIRERGMHAVT